MLRLAARANTFKKRNFNERTHLFLMGLPLLLLVFVFSYLPLAGWVYSFFNYQAGLDLLKTPFVGLKNFVTIIGDSRVWGSLKNTLIFYLLNLLTYPLPVIFAILINEANNRPFKKLVQTFTTLPNFVSWVIVFSLAFGLFSNDGMVNTVLVNMNIIKEPNNLLGDSNIVYGFQTVLNIWKSLGWNAIIYLAAIAGIDSELYDAVKVDGAGRLQTILHITIPMIMPTFFVMLILGISSMLSVGFDQFLLFYNGMVADKITVLDVYVYRVGILNDNISYSTAICMIKSLVGILLLVIANRLSIAVRKQGIL
jgi:putative aldouronate transport system permease protein